MLKRHESKLYLILSFTDFDLKNQNHRSYMAEIVPIRDKQIFNESMKSKAVNDSIIQRKSMKKK